MPLLRDAPAPARLYPYGDVYPYGAAAKTRLVYVYPYGAAAKTRLVYAPPRTDQIGPGTTAAAGSRKRK